jgi:hypothetical protein
VWTEKSSKLFTKAMKDFKPDRNGYTRCSNIKKHLVRKGFPKLATKFLTRCKKSEPWFAVECAKNYILCPICRDRFPRHRNCILCSICCKTQKGKDYTIYNRKQTCIKRYGGPNPMCSKIIQNRYKQSILKKYGVTNLGKSKIIRKRVRKTMIKRYGVVHALQSKELLSKSQVTCMKNYGVKHPLQNRKLLLKAIRSSKNLHRIKCGGRVYECQGYERFVIPALVKKFGTEDVVSQFDKEFKPIKFSDGSTYTPDAYIKSKKTYIDAKSFWTLVGRPGKTNYEIQNKEMQEVVNASKIKLRFAVYFPEDEKIVVLPREWCFWTKAKLENYMSFS